MAVLEPLKLIIDNYPKGKTEQLEAENNPEDPSMGTRQIPFSRELYIEKSDFREDPPKKFFRLAPGKEVRLKHAYYITCDRIVKDKDTGEIKELHCSYDPETRGGWSQDGRRVMGTLHWVSVEHSAQAEIRLYDHLFIRENPGEEDGDELTDALNPDSLKILKGCRIETGLLEAQPGHIYQFLRQGYFCADAKDFKKENPVFNRAVALRDTWAKILNAQKSSQK
jgi:glutaminyl-tRNA synthetase